jgi:hypothetical protein
MSKNEETVSKPNVTNAPPQIWLVYGAIDGDCDHRECSEVTWAANPVHKSDVEYVRADVLKSRDAEIKKLRIELESCTRLLETKRYELLDEMWKEMEACQSVADKDGHGDTWRKMCAERSQDAASLASLDPTSYSSSSSGLWRKTAAFRAGKAQALMVMAAKTAAAALIALRNDATLRNHKKEDR